MIVNTAKSIGNAPVLFCCVLAVDGDSQNVFVLTINGTIVNCLAIIKANATLCTVRTVAKKSGSLSSVKATINGKDYKAKKKEFEFSQSTKSILFKGENLSGSWTVK